MRGADGYTESMFTMSRLDDPISESHPLRPIRLYLNEALTRMGGVFSSMYEIDAKEKERPNGTRSQKCVQMLPDLSVCPLPSVQHLNQGNSASIRS
ncbi:transposase, IS4 family protein [Caballeronia glebae]|uniref:Transposase, IS4 family protein n=1 Tax=Caballeronia glebae TaxID=1777143 RepID=A0A158D4W1_9BURK|nr:transposase, IS4 family protein [Caballeronia glebae]